MLVDIEDYFNHPPNTKISLHLIPEREGSGEPEVCSWVYVGDLTPQQAFFNRRIDLIYYSKYVDYISLEDFVIDNLKLISDISDCYKGCDWSHNMRANIGIWDLAAFDLVEQFRSLYVQAVKEKKILSFDQNLDMNNFG